MRILLALAVIGFMTICAKRGQSAAADASSEPEVGRRRVPARANKTVGENARTTLGRATADVDALPRLEVIDVGQGSALLLLDAGGQAILVDAGPAAGGEAVLDALARANVSRVRLAVLSHFDSDHVGGLWRVWAGADGISGTDDDTVIESFWDRGSVPEPQAEVAREYLISATKRRRAHHGDTLTGDDISLQVVSSPAAAHDLEENARGIALCGRVGQHRFLYLGDLPEDLGFQAASECGTVDVLIASHHGSAEDTSERILRASSPKLILVSAGLRNPYCHPAAVTLARLSAHEVWITGAAGLDAADGCPVLLDLPWATEIDDDILDAAGAALRGPGPHHVLVAGDLVIAG